MPKNKILVLARKQAKELRQQYIKEGKLDPNKNYNTGCCFLDAHGIKESSITEGINLCLKFCPFPTCVIDTYDKDLVENYQPPKVGEYMIQCTKCKTMETITMIGNRLQPHQKFVQIGNTIYHRVNCGVCKFIK